MACCCFEFAVVRISKVGVFSVAIGVRQVLRAMVASSAIRVAKLCTGVSSSRMWRATLVKATLDRVAGATGSRTALACWSVSANISSRQASRICHST